MHRSLRLMLAPVVIAAILVITLAVQQYDPSSSRGRFLAPEEMISSQTTAASATLASGEAPIQRTDDSATAALALRYQPTVVTSAADPFWPVSVLAALRMRWRRHGTCLYSRGHCQLTNPPASALSGRGEASDFLQYPTAVDSASDTFLSAARVLGLRDADIRHWQRAPSDNDPFRSAQMYFYYLREIPAGVYRGLRGDLVSLEYWFYYPLNYLPLARIPFEFLRRLMASAIGFTDYHQGDFEHVAVLLDRITLQPRYLWMARHGSEGQAYRWHTRRVQWSGDHAFIYGALGSHASYAQCGVHRRSLTYLLVNDYVICRPNRTYAFTYRATPLVDLEHTSWACWRGHLGKAGRHLSRVRVALIPYETDGPVSPLRQRENARTACHLRPPRATGFSGFS